MNIMAIPIQIKNIFPNSKIASFDPYVEECFEYANINTKLRKAMFYAQAGIESAYFKTLSENLNYSAIRLSIVWPKKFKDKLGNPNDLAKRIASNPKLIASEVYGDKLGNTKENAYLYIGRGLIQLTGYVNYKAFNDDMGSYLNTDFIKHPDALLEPRNALYSACHFWKTRNLNKFADKGDVKGATKVINGSYTALRERQELYNKILKII